MECPELQNPTNGTVTYDERVYPNEAVYECEDGFELSGEATRECQINGEWTNDAPECKPEEEEEEEEEEEDDGKGINRCYNIEREQKIDIMCMLVWLISLEFMRQEANAAFV